MSRNELAKVEELRQIVADLRYSKSVRQDAIKKLRPMEERLGLGSSEYNGDA